MTRSFMAYQLQGMQPAQESASMRDGVTAHLASPLPGVTPLPRTAFMSTVIPGPTPARPYHVLTCVVCDERYLPCQGQPHRFCRPCLRSPARRVRCEQGIDGQPMHDDRAA